MVLLGKSVWENDSTQAKQNSIFMLINTNSTV